MDEFEIIQGREVTEDDIAQALSLDFETYEDEYHCSLKQCLSWFRVNENIYTMIRDRNSGRIVAYVNISPVTDEYYEKIRSGSFVDTYLPPEAILPFEMPGLYKLYFSSIVIRSDYQNRNVLRPLFNAVVDMFIRLGKEEILFESILADAVSDRGRKFCRLFGMQKLRDTGHGSEIYEIKLCPPEFKISSSATKQLHDFYRRKMSDFLSEEQMERTEHMLNETPERKPYQVFISFKKTYGNNEDTPDCKLAEQLYSEFRKRKIPTFFSKATLAETGTDEFKREIDLALDQAKVLIAVGTSAANLESGWVRYEWDGFQSDILSGKKADGALFSYIDVMKRQDLPRALRTRQVFEQSIQSPAEVCEYALKALRNHSVDPVPDPTPVPVPAPVEYAEIKESSRDFYKNFFKDKRIVDSEDVLMKFVRQYSDLFSLVTCVQDLEGNVEADGDLIGFLYRKIQTAGEDSNRNILKITGNNGSDKNALMQLLYLLAHQDMLRGNSRFVPYYINLAVCEKQAYASPELQMPPYDPERPIAPQIAERIKKYTLPFRTFCEQNPKFTPLLFIDGIRDYTVCQTLPEKLLEGVLSPLKNRAYKVVSVDTNFTDNPDRIKRDISFAPRTFDYIAKISPVDLVDEELCRKYFQANGEIYRKDYSSIYAEMQKYPFYEIDSYVVRLLEDKLTGHFGDKDFTVSDLCESVCLQKFDNKNMLLEAAKTAFEFSYSERTKTFEDKDYYASKSWGVIKKHKIILDFLVSYYYFDRLLHFTGEEDLPFFDRVFPKGVTRFVTPLLKNSETAQEKVLEIAGYYDRLGNAGKSEITFWLGRLHNSLRREDAKRLLEKLYREQCLCIRKKREGAYTSEVERKTDLFLLRGISVSLINMGMDDVADEYLLSLLSDDLANAVNRAFEMEYYGDKPHQKRMLDFEDKLEKGKRTFNRLLKNIRGHMESKKNIPVLKLELFTLCSLIQARISRGRETTKFPVKPYLEKCVGLLERYRGVARHTQPPKITAYFDMVGRDFAEYLKSERHNSMPCAILNEYGDALQRGRRCHAGLDTSPCESVTEHMYGVWLMAAFNLPETGETGYDKKRILDLLLIHDLGKSLTCGADESPHRAGLGDREDRTMKMLFLKGTYQDVINLDYYYSLWEEWAEQKSINALIARDIDVIQSLYRFCRLCLKKPEEYPEEVRRREFETCGNLQSDIGDLLFQKLIRQNTEFQELFSEK